MKKIIFYEMHVLTDCNSYVVREGGQGTYCTDYWRSRSGSGR